MVDLAISADRPDRTLHVVSRTDAVPRPHVLPTTPPVPPPPGVTRTQGLDALRSTLAAHVAHTVETTGDWRAAIDGLRPVTAQLWRGLSEADKRRFIAEDARTWDVHRHRMAPATSRRFDAIAHEGRIERHRGTIAAVRAGGARPPRQPGRRHHPARGRGRQLHRPGRLDRRRPAADAPRPDRPRPPRPGRAWASTPPTTAGSSARCPTASRSSRSARCAAATCGSRRRCRRSASRPTTWPAW